MKTHIIHLAETESTNSYAVQLLASERPQEGTVIVADFQTRGKGTDANSWESEKGKNLTFSLILYPAFRADRQFVLNKAISTAIYKFLVKELGSHKVSIKWPNDLYVGDKKICGILIKNSVIGNRFEYVVVGIGLNVNQTVFASLAPNPVSMKNISGFDFALNDALDSLLDCIALEYETVQKGRYHEIESAYHVALYRLGQQHEYIIRGAKTFATITGTNEYGQLLLETPDRNLVICDMKEVRFFVDMTFPQGRIL